MRRCVHRWRVSTPADLFETKPAYLTSISRTRWLAAMSPLNYMRGPDPKTRARQAQAAETQRDW